MTIHYVGWFSELPHGDPNGVSLKSVLGEIEGENRKKVAAYLDAGYVLAETLGTTCLDPIATEPIEIGPLRTLTDGVLVYPSDLPYYVREYGAGIPSMCLARLRELDFRMPILSDDELGRLAERILSGEAN